MGIPLIQQLRVGSYIVKQRLTGNRRYPLVLMLEPLFRNSAKPRRHAQHDGAGTENAGGKTGPVRNMAKVERWQQDFRGEYRG